MIRPKRLSTRGPQLETVCLDCGTVLEHHSMPQDVAKAPFGERYE